MAYDPIYELACEQMARAGKKKPRRRKMTVTKLPDDPRIGRKAESRARRSKPFMADRQPMRGDRIGESEDAVWLNVGRMIEDAPGKISGKPLA